MGKMSRKIARQQMNPLERKMNAKRFTIKDIQEAYERGYRQGEMKGFERAIKEINRMIIGRIKTIKGIGEKTIAKIVKELGIEEQEETNGEKTN